MKKPTLFFLFILFNAGITFSYSQLFNITYSNKLGENKSPKIATFYINDAKNEITYSDEVDTFKYSPLELSETKYEQGLYFEIYNPTLSDLIDNPGLKRIFRFGYDKPGGKPVLVAKITYFSKDKYYVQLYYTDYYFELGSNRH